MTLEERALEIAELKSKASAALTADNFDEWLDLMCREAVAMEALRKELLQKSTVVARNPDAIRVLQKIGLTNLEDPKKLGQHLLYSWFDDQDYAIGISCVNALIVPVSVPVELCRFVEEARQCYALSQNNAVYSLSRTILESAVNDLCIRTGRVPKRVFDEELLNEEGFTFRRRVSLLANRPRVNRICDHYRLLCRVVHGDTTVGSGEALAALVETLGFVHHLYAINQYLIRTDA
jgi:hypothetical protein